MSSFDDLAALRLEPLAEVLASHAPAQADLTAGQWLGVVELLTMRLTHDFGDLSTEHREICSSAFGHTLDSAVTSGAIDYRESLIRRINLSLALLQNTPPDTSVDLLNPGPLIELLLLEVPMSAEEAGAMSADWRRLDISQIRDLRMAKNLISPGLAIARLMREEELDPRLQEWERVLPSLP
ncbi:hypothetical protein ACFXKC_49075 [Streptomyces sp. NPDC059340]|uniref:hypothetical protein n=1 Tax=Streptomyces sp. NPDC059340 TaxID=3346806 RepID=UPI00369E40E5